MKKQKLFLLTLLLGLCLLPTQRSLAEEIEVLRGEETETEIFLEGSEDIYSLMGELESQEEFVLVKAAESENSWDYQAVAAATGEQNPWVLLSSRGAYGYGLSLRLKVEGVRIGTGTITLGSLQAVDENGEWLEGTELPPITVHVLPNPLLVSLSGTQGSNGWYTSPVTVSVTDKDAKEIWYDSGSGKCVYTEPFSVSRGKTLLTVTSDDGYGYKKEETRWVYVDTTAPVLSVSKQECTWQQEAVEVTVEASDSLSGLSSLYWAISESREEHNGWNALFEDGFVSMDEDGSWYLYLKASDNAGNETTAVYGPYQKDAIKPEITFENLCQEQLVEEGITPEITVTDSCSGIKTVTYLLDGQTWSPAELTGKGKHTLTVTAEDFAGNSTTETVEFAIYDRITVTASAEEARYTEGGFWSAKVTHHEAPLVGAEVEFFINGEAVGTACTDEEGLAWLVLPVELAPGESELKVKVSQNDELFLLGAEDRVVFTAKPEHAWLVYGGDYSVWQGAPLCVRLEIGELPDERAGDITRAELLVELYKIEKDGSRTLVEETILTPDERGRASCEFYQDTGLYELKTSFTESSWYTGQEIILHPAVFDIDASLDLKGGSLLLDLPHLGLYVNVVFTFLPPSLDAEIEVQIPGTGITLTENRITDYELTAKGLVLYGKAVNPADGTVYCYEVRSAYTMGIFLNELEVLLWKGEDKTQEPVYHFEWNAEEDKI